MIGSHAWYNPNKSKDDTQPAAGELVERLAREIAFWHGQKITHHERHEGAVTVASSRGFGRWADAPTKYSEAHWQEYRCAAERIAARIEALEQERQKFADLWADCHNGHEAKIATLTAQVKEIIEGLLMEWAKFTRYGSPIAKAANERIARARAWLEQTK